MGFVLTEEQESIRKSARAFVRDRLPIGHFRRLRDEKDPLGYSREVWKEFCATGLPSVAIPEEFGGGGLGMAELGLVLEELGRTLAPTPIISTMLMSANAILLGEFAKDLIPGVVSGDKVIAFALDEGTRFNPASIQAKANGSSISGEKSYVPDGSSADAFVVAVEGGSFAYVPASAKGISVSRLSTVDSRNVARVRFENSPTPVALVSGDVLDRATAGLAAEMLGGIQQMFETTLEYLKTRKQFGVVIGSFQALKHRAAYMFCEIELTKSAVYDALRALDANRPDASLMVSAAKARANDTFLLVSSEAIQMHGGIGATDELDVGFYYKRARVADLMFGDSAYHRDRFARLSGY